MPRAGRIEFDALNPEDESVRLIWISRKLVDKVSSRHPPRRIAELAYNMPETVITPLSIWSGIRDHGSSGEPDWGYAYIGLPSFKPDGYGNKFVPSNQVFAVYLNDNWDIFDWTWEEVDPNDPIRPKRFKGGQYGKLLWPKYQTN